MSQGLARIDTILENSFERFGLKKKLKEFVIARVWQEVVGESIARRMQPSCLVGKTLHVTVSSSAWMEELKYLKADIIERINMRLNERVVEEMAMKVGSVGGKNTTSKPLLNPPSLSQEERKVIGQLVSPLKDEELKEIVTRILEKARCIRPQPL
ncbi:MAG: DUF721 domain-containing protein [Deltaproteobacteria bacterium]|nr:DUF721 domain-containing protein [Deltaproteobacteria bacterium]